jgi:DNA-directed RNA polymerase beta' subunit
MSHDRHVIRHEVEEVRFGFFTDAEIKAISVKQITSPVTFDALNNALPGGLYDPALGPTQPHTKCITCGQDQTDCPGHIGHVELAAVVYHPLLFPILYKLLRSKCLSCHRLRLGHRRCRVYAIKLALADSGDTAAARQLDIELKGNSPYEGDLEENDKDLIPDIGIQADAVSYLQLIMILLQNQCKLSYAYQHLYCLDADADPGEV